MGGNCRIQNQRPGMPVLLGEQSQCGKQPGSPVPGDRRAMASIPKQAAICSGCFAAKPQKGLVEVRARTRMGSPHPQPYQRYRLSGLRGKPVVAKRFRSRESRACPAVASDEKQDALAFESEDREQPESLVEVPEWTRLGSKGHRQSQGHRMSLLLREKGFIGSQSRQGAPLCGSPMAPDKERRSEAGANSSRIEETGVVDVQGRA